VALRLLVAHTPAERDAARAVEAGVFLQAFGNTPEVMAREYGPYEERSRFVTVIDEATGGALGAARLIATDGLAPVKTLVDVAGPPWQLDVDASLRTAGLAEGPVWDVGSLAVERRFRSGASGGEVIVALCHGVHRYSMISGVRGLVTVLDDRILRVVRSMGMPWLPMPGASSQHYLGSPASTPCAMVMADVAGSIQAKRPDLGPAVVDGVLPSIACDPADLSPGRGALLSELDAQPAQPLPPRRDTTGWRPPTAQRAAERSSSQAT
jgi:hypothetical protein